MVLFLILLSIAPSIAIMLFFYKKDKYKQEPFGLLCACFAGGIASAIAVITFFVFVESYIPINSIIDNRFVDSFVSSFLTAAIPEELVKFAVLYILIWDNRDFEKKYDGILYAVFVSLGFATLENILYVLRGGVNVAFLRAITAVPAHALFGVAMGFYFSYAKFIREKTNKYLALSITIPIVLHGFYDFFIFFQEKYLDSHPIISLIIMVIFFAFVILLWIQGFKKIRQLSKDFYFDGIPLNEILTYYEQPNIQTTPQISQNYLLTWQEATPMLYKNEKNEILAKYPNAIIKNENNLMTVVIRLKLKYDWRLSLNYKNNYKRNRSEISIHIIKPEINDLIATNAIPYSQVLSNNTILLDVAPLQDIKGVKLIDNAQKWIVLLEKWIDEEIELHDFKLSLD